MQGTATITFTGDHQQWDHSDYWGRRNKFVGTYKRNEKKFECTVNFFGNAFVLERPMFFDRWRMQYDGFYDELGFEYDVLGQWAKVQIECTDIRVNAMANRLPEMLRKRIHKYLVGCH